MSKHRSKAAGKLKAGAASASEEEKLSIEDGLALNKSIESVVSKRGRPSIPEQ